MSFCCETLNLFFFSIYILLDGRSPNTKTYSRPNSESLNQRAKPKQKNTNGLRPKWLSRANQRGDRRLTTRYHHRTRPNLEDNVGGDENHRELRRNTPGSEMTNTEIPQDLNQNTAPTSNDSIGNLKETASSIVHVREINRTEIEISSMLRSTITTNPTHTLITTGEWNGSRQSPHRHQFFSTVTKINRRTVSPKGARTAGNRAAYTTVEGTTVYQSQ